MNQFYERFLFYFNEISKIPRNSGEEKLISNYIVHFAQEHNLEFFQDEYNNVLIKKAATGNKQDTIILQGHLDMVCIKDTTSNHDFQTKGIDLLIGKKFITANKTTLGADNGVAIAYMLVILESDINHPNLECLFTTDEEEGMSGIKNFDFNLLKGKYFINLDNETENEVIIGSAGGIKTKFYQTNQERINNFLPTYKIEISNLAGGHSGVEIDKGLYNSNLLTAELLQFLQKEEKIFISEFIGGKKDNAISNYTECIVHSNIENIENKIQEFKKQLVLNQKDQNLKINVSIVKNSDSYDETTSKHIINFLIHCRQNVITRFDDGTLCTSANIGMVNISKNKNEIMTLLRSGDEKDLNNIIRQNERIADTYNYKYVYSDSYPVWSSNKISLLLEKYINLYKNITNKKIKAKRIHAGLECCIVKQKKKDMDMISIGPNIKNAHTTEEKLEIISCQEILYTLIKLLEEW